MDCVTISSLSRFLLLAGHVDRVSFKLFSELGHPVLLAITLSEPLEGLDGVQVRSPLTDCLRIAFLIRPRRGGPPWLTIRGCHSLSRVFFLT